MLAASRRRSGFESGSVLTRLTPERIAAFGVLLRDRLDTADIETRKTCLGAVLSELRVGYDRIDIIGDRVSLAAVIAGQLAADGTLSAFARKWRALQNEDAVLYLFDLNT